MRVADRIAASSISSSVKPGRRRPFATARGGRNDFDRGTIIGRPVWQIAASRPETAASADRSAPSAEGSNPLDQGEGRSLAAAGDARSSTPRRTASRPSAMGRPWRPSRRFPSHPMRQSARPRRCRPNRGPRPAPRFRRISAGLPPARISLSRVRANACAVAVSSASTACRRPNRASSCSTMRLPMRILVARRTSISENAARSARAITAPQAHPSHRGEKYAEWLPARPAAVPDSLRSAAADVESSAS